MPDYLTARAENAEAERDAAIAGAYEAAADHCWNKRDLLADAEKKQVEAGLTGRDYYGRRLEAELLSRSIHNLTPADALAARDRRDAQMRAEGRKEGLREAAGITLSHRERWRCAGGFEGHATGAKLIRDAILAAAEKGE